MHRSCNKQQEMCDVAQLQTCAISGIGAHVGRKGCVTAPGYSRCSALWRKASLSQSEQKWTAAVVVVCSAAEMPSRHVITLRTSKLLRTYAWPLAGVDCRSGDTSGSLPCLSAVGVD